MLIGLQDLSAAYCTTILKQWLCRQGAATVRLNPSEAINTMSRCIGVMGMLRFHFHSHLKVLT